MSKTVKIPDNMKPWKATINGVTYEYEPGTMQTVPDEVAELILRATKEEPAPAAGAPWEIKIPEPASQGVDLPEVTADDNGDVLAVVEGAWAKLTPAPVYDLVIDWSDEDNPTLVKGDATTIATGIRAGQPMTGLIISTFPDHDNPNWTISTSQFVNLAVANDDPTDMIVSVLFGDVSVAEALIWLLPDNTLTTVDPY